MFDECNNEVSFLDESAHFVDNLIPTYSKVSEDALYAVAAMEQTYTNTMKEIGVMELNAVMEGVKIDPKVIWNKIKTKVVELWNNFITFCKEAGQKVLYVVMSKIDVFKKEKVTPAAIKAALVKAKREDASALYNKFNSWARTSWYEITATDIGGISDALKAALDDCMDYVDQVKKAYDDTESKTSALPDSMSNDAMEERIARRLNNALKSSGINLTAEIVKDSAKLKECFEKEIVLKNKDQIKFKDGADAAEYLIAHTDDIYKNLTGCHKKFNETIRKPYRTCKTTLNRVVSEAKSADKDFEYRGYIKVATKSAKLASTLVGVAESQLVKSFIWQFRLLATGARISRTAKNESAYSYDSGSSIYESSSFQSELDSLWTW